ncbi:MAG: hypothetical protein IKL28_04045 [Lachnospiraceae bacterium]|nr:hypothetical protein [Lachnospiraceae bacterium]
MSGTVLKKRELYIDVALKDDQLSEIFLYQVDFFRDFTFRTKGFLYKKEEEEVKEYPETDRPEVKEDEFAPPEPLDLFKEQWELLCVDEISTEVYATDATRVMEYVMEPLQQKYPDFKTTPCVRGGREFLHDCVSMGRVISMSVFDEEQYLSADIRRRMKERYHDYVDEIKEGCPEHIFIRQTVSEEMPVYLLTITDDSFRIKKQVMLNRGMKEETIAIRLKEILSLYPEADVIIDAVTKEFYRVFQNINRFMDVECRKRLFSLESMLAALGKAPKEQDMVKTYLAYIKNQEEMRFGTFLPERLYSVHCFYLPVQLSGEAAWKSQFEKNTVWKQSGKECYSLDATGELKGKYSIKAGKEQFILKVRTVSLKRYLKKYAVLRIEVENFCYPGKEDKARINALAADLFAGVNENADAMELKIKDGKQAYSLTSVPMEGNEGQLWLNGLLALGRKKKKEKNALVLTALKEQMYCVETTDATEEEEIIQMAVIRDGLFRKIENSMAKAIKPEKNGRPVGRLVRGQKKTLKELHGMYRYIVASFGEEYETTQNAERKQSWSVTVEALGTAEVTGRLDRKFGMFF